MKKRRLFSVIVMCSCLLLVGCKSESKQSNRGRESANIFSLIQDENLLTADQIEEDIMNIREIRNSGLNVDSGETIEFKTKNGDRMSFDVQVSMSNDYVANEMLVSLDYDFNGDEWVLSDYSTESMSGGIIKELTEADAVNLVNSQLDESLDVDDIVSVETDLSTQKVVIGYVSSGFLSTSWILEFKYDKSLGDLYLSDYSYF